MLHKLILEILGVTRSVADHQKAGFALPLAMMLGMIMLAIAGTSLLVAQGDRNSAVQRKTSNASLLVSDSAVSRALLELNKSNNGVLLIRNYDPTDPKTGKNYLGADGIPKSGDESTTAVDQWTGHDPSGTPCFQQLGRSAPNIALTGTIGANETYTIRAYRYDKQNKQGTLLVEGNYKGQTSWVAVTLSIEPILDDFPSLLLNYHNAPVFGVLALRGRQVLGNKGNIYYPPSSSADSALASYSKPGDATRPNYLNAIYSSSTQDGANSDTVSGKIFACQLSPNIPYLNPLSAGPNLETITSSQRIAGTGGAAPTYFQVDKIDLANSDTLTVDTTNGPVYLTVTDKGNPGYQPDLAITLHNNAKILNVRRDGQSPKVGDFRILVPGNSQTNLYDRTCIQNAFLWVEGDELRILTSGPGCPGGQNTNYEGVVWAEQILFSKNAASNRTVSTYSGGANQEFDSLVNPGATSGIAVPDDLSSLSDVLEYVDWPARYRYGSIKNWQRVN
jgi:hypothetical protein